MQIFSNSKIWKKIVIVFLIIGCLGNIVPKNVILAADTQSSDSGSSSSGTSSSSDSSSSSASSDSDNNASPTGGLDESDTTTKLDDEAHIGGTLAKPICSFVVWAGDGIINILHTLLVKQDTTIITISKKGTSGQVLRVLITILAIAGVVATGVGVLGLSSIIGALGAVVGSVIVATTIGAVYAGFGVYNSKYFDNDIDIPLYYITPEEIIKGEIPLFNVNFFDPGFNENDEEELKNAKYNEETGKLEYNGKEISNYWSKYTDPYWAIGGWDPSLVEGEWKSVSYEDYYLKIPDDQKIDVTDSIDLKTPPFTSGTVKYVVVKNGDYKGTYAIQTTQSSGFDGSGGTANSVMKNDSTISTKNGQLENSEMLKNIRMPISYQLQKTISKWYYRILLLATISMMSVLVYVGIRILITSSATDKAKYKQFAWDWFLGMMILFMMHYGMIFMNKLNDSLVDMMGSINENVYFPEMSDTSDGALIKQLTDMGFDVQDWKSETKITKLTVLTHEENGTTYFSIPTNMMGLLRYNVQYNKANSMAYMGWTIMFIVMMMYTVYFAFTYLKRVIYLAFLTMIAPLVALTYPIDKMNDGSAQGFNYWTKEYVFNLLLQPLHLLLYTILISSAIELSTENILYSIVAIGFLIPAEKILRAMFNFSKAQTPGSLVGGAAALKGTEWLLNKIGGSGKGDGGSSSGSGDSSESSSSGTGTFKGASNLNKLGEMNGTIGNGSDSGISGNVASVLGSGVGANSGESNVLNNGSGSGQGGATGVIGTGSGRNSGIRRLGKNNSSSNGNRRFNVTNGPARRCSCVRWKIY